MTQIDEPFTPQVDCIICAAGASRRMGEWKLSLPWFHNSPPQSIIPYLPEQAQDPWLVDATVSTALAAGCRVILVTGYRAQELEDRFSRLPGVQVVRNEHWEQGMVSSIQTALPLVQSPWFFIVHGDMPLIQAGWYTKLLHGMTKIDIKTPTSIAIRPVYSSLVARIEDKKPALQVSNPIQGQYLHIQNPIPGHPVLFSASAIPLIAKAPQGDSLTSIFTECKVITIETEDESVIQDIDTLESYIRALTDAVPAMQGRARHGTAILNQACHGPMPRALLQQPDAVSETQLSAHLITGIQGSGKTSLLRRIAFHQFISLLQEDDLRTSLFIMISQVQTSRGHDGKALGFTVKAFYHEPSGNLSFFSEPLCATDQDLCIGSSLKLGRYFFYPDTFKELIAWLDPALQTNYNHIYFYIDELGKLELDQQQGLWPLFERILQNQTKCLQTMELTCTVRQDRYNVLERFLKKIGYSIQKTECRAP
jgi:molybdenum cofactor cytidylyltransferase